MKTIVFAIGVCFCFAAAANEEKPADLAKVVEVRNKLDQCVKTKADCVSGFVRRKEGSDLLIIASCPPTKCGPGQISYSELVVEYKKGSLTYAQSLKEIYLKTEKAHILNALAVAYRSQFEIHRVKK